MLKGDLTTTPLAPLLLQLGADQLTGCLVVTDPADEQAQVFLRSGLVYAVMVPGRRPQLGAKLVSSGALGADQLDEGLEAQRSVLHGWRLGELLVHLGYVEQSVVEAFVREQVDDAMWDLMRWTTGTWKFRKNIRTREDVTSPTSVESLLTTLRERGYEWESISAVVHGPRAVPRRSGSTVDPDSIGLDPDARSLLALIDGERTLAELAVACGFTQFEAGQILVSLVGSGLVDIDEAVDATGSAPYGASALAAALQDAADRRSAAASVTTGPDDASADADPAAGPDLEKLRRSDESFAASMARVSSALSDVLGPTSSPEQPDPDNDLRVRRARERSQVVEDAETQRRRDRARADAAELAAAHTIADALRDADQPPVTPVVAVSGPDEEDLRRAAAAALREAAMSDGPPPVPATDEAEPETEPAPAPTGPSPADTPRPDLEATDTAALLRELSSLGADDEPERPALTPPRLPRATTNDPKKQRKKIGLFGL